jgi:signal transduction histidine kinase
MVGKPHGSILGKALIDFIAESDRPAFRSLLEGRDGGQADIALRGPNRTLVATQATMTVVQDHKLLLFSDVSERKRHQAFDELTRKFLSMMAHEFRNILGPVGNSVELLKRHPGLDAEGQKSVAVIQRQTERMLALVDDLRRINPRD